MICAFFGHRDAPRSITPTLEKTIIKIIEQYPDITFYVGTHGGFDRMVISLLKKISAEYTMISCAVILAYLPTDKTNTMCCDLPTIYPEGIECVPKKYAVSFRNDWIVRQADMVVCYITHDFGGAAKFVEKARKKGKIIYNVSKNEILDTNKIDLPKI